MVIRSLGHGKWKISLRALNQLLLDINSIHNQCSLKCLHIKGEVKRKK